MVDIPDDDSWTNGTCSCPVFLKQYVSKRLIGVAIRLRKAKPLAAVKTIPNGQKRRRGRPKLANIALLSLRAGANLVNNIRSIFFSFLGTNNFFFFFFFLVKNLIPTKFADQKR